MSEPNGPGGRAGLVRLRPYQHDAIARLRDRVRAGTRRIVLVAPTGSGKTSIAAHVIASAAERGSRVLFIAHRRELINQAYARLLATGLHEQRLGVVMGQDRRRRPGAPVQVASVDTLRNRPKPRADVVFVDEAHRSTSKSYRDIAACYPDAIHIGLTATPYRADGAGLGDLYDDLLVVSSPRELIAQGFLVEPRVFTVPPDARPDLSSVRVQRGDYDHRALADALDRKGLVGNLVEHWMTHARDVRTVAFAVSVAHSEHIAAQFRAAGVAAEHLAGTTPLDERDAILARLDAGTTQVVSNCGVLCEGWDQPAAKCAILARPTKSPGLYLQQAGRILRPYNGQPAIILDHSGCVLEHGLPQDDRQHTLEGTRGRAKTSAPPPVRTCPACFAVLPLATRGCPHCGEALVEGREIPEERDGSLVEVRPEDHELHGLPLSERVGRSPPKSRGPRLDERAMRAVLRDAARSRTGTVDWATLDAAIRR